MNKTLEDYLKIKRDFEWRGYRVFFERGALGRGWNLMFTPFATKVKWKRHITWFNKNPLL